MPEKGKKKVSDFPTCFKLLKYSGMNPTLRILKLLSWYDRSTKQFKWWRTMQWKCTLKMYKALATSVGWFFPNHLKVLRHTLLYSSVLILREVTNRWSQPHLLILSFIQKLLQLSPDIVCNWKTFSVQENLIIL